jgi:hypothetical protein
MKLVAGSGGMGNTVRWVHMVEDSEVPDFLHGNELIFTTGIGHVGNEWLIPFVQRLKEHNAVGLVVNVGPYIDTIPSKVIVYCEENDFPLFTLPWKVRIIDITYRFCRRIIDNEETETTLSEAFRNLIFFPDKKEGYAATLEKQGFRKSSEYIALAAQLCGDKARAAAMWRNDRFGLWRLLKRAGKSMASFFQNERLIVIYQNMSHDEMKRLLGELTEFECEMRLNIGVSEIGDGYAEIPMCYNQAVSALSAAAIKGDKITLYRDIGVYKLLFGVNNREILNSYVESTLGNLIKYDSMNGTDYVNTLKTYLECSGSVQQSAQILNVHRNTVNYKIKIIREIMNTELDDEDKMKILLAFRAKEVLEQH